jgi:hypothetical protein
MESNSGVKFLIRLDSCRLDGVGECKSGIKLQPVTRGGQASHNFDWMPCDHPGLCLKVFGHLALCSKLAQGSGCGASDRDRENQKTKNFRMNFANS